MPRILPSLPNLPHLTLTSVFDILIVAFLIYQLMVILRGRRAAPVLLGLAVLTKIWPVLLAPILIVWLARRFSPRHGALCALALFASTLWWAYTVTGPATPQEPRAGFR